MVEPFKQDTEFTPVLFRVPDYLTRRLRDAWGRGYDRAESEFVPVRHPDTAAIHAWPQLRLA